MKHGLRMGSALALGLLVACASGAGALRDEGSERIEEAMRPELHPDVIPEGIVLGDDAPPLASPEPELARVTECAPSCRDFSTPGPWLYPVPVVPGAPAGPYPGAVRFHIEARPGGSIPGLLP
ncbi:MAG TPA: hypothetical protein VF815_22595 [Myxococcaceae bacterium]